MLGRDVGFTTQDLETIDGIEKEVEELRMLISANEGYGADSDQRPEDNNDEGSNLETTNQTDDAQQMQIN